MYIGANQIRCLKKKKKDSIKWDFPRDENHLVGKF